MRLLAVFLVISSISMCAACPVQARELTVSAAISLKEAFGEIGRLFQCDHPQDKVLFNFAASGELARQIERGAPVDVFASAAVDQVKRLEAGHLVQNSSVKTFARNRLVVIVPADEKSISTLADLPHLKLVAIGSPKTVPAGEYARQALVKAGVFLKLESAKKLVFTESVRQTLDYVESGNVDAGLVYKTDARIGRNIKTAFGVPDGYTEPIVYPICVVSDSKSKDLAEQFVQSVLSKQGQAVLRSKGFISIEK